MKKTISIILAISLLLLCLSSCGPKYVTGDYVYTADKKVYTISSQSSGLWGPYPDSLEEHENNCRKYDEYIIFKFTPVGGSFVQHIGFIDCDSLLFTPVKITEIIECGKDNKLKVGDIVYCQEYYIVINDENIDFYQKFANLHDITLEIGDYYPAADYPLDHYHEPLMMGETYFMMATNFWTISSQINKYGVELVTDGYTNNYDIFRLNPEDKPEEVGHYGENYVKVWEQVMAKYYQA